MAEISKFTQPDSAPAYFIEFLDFLDRGLGYHASPSHVERRRILMTATPDYLQVTQSSLRLTAMTPLSEP